MDLTIVDLKRREAIAAEPVTLDGQQAWVMGITLPKAIIARSDRTSRECEWEQVFRTVEFHGGFFRTN